MLTIGENSNLYSYLFTDMEVFTGMYKFQQMCMHALFWNINSDKASVSVNYKLCSLIILVFKQY